MARNDTGDQECGRVGRTGRRALSGLAVLVAGLLLGTTAAYALPLPDGSWILGSSRISAGGPGPLLPSPARGPRGSSGDGPARSRTAPGFTPGSTPGTAVGAGVPPFPGPPVQPPAALAVPQPPPAPAPSPPPPAAPAGPGPGGAFPVPGQESWVSIPRLGIALAVFGGGQSVIDRGVVTHYDPPAGPRPVRAGQAGTYWLAAHHVTHGAPFLHLPDVRPGDLVVVTPADGSPAVRYRITSLGVVGVVVPTTTVYGTDPTSPRLLLQTCEGSSQRLLVHGVLA